MNRVAVIIPAFQAANTIGQTLTTLFKQTRLPDEVVVVDDGSSDGLEMALAPWIEKIKFVRQKNQGAPVARNIGFAATTAEFVLFLDADIIMKPTMIERMVTTMEHHPEAAFAYADFRFGWKHFRLHPFSLKKLQSMNYIHTSSLLRRSEFPGFDPNLKKFQDWDLWLTIAERGGVGVWISEILYTVQTREKSLGLSTWLPKFVYQLPFIGQGKGNATVAAYRQAEFIIRRKHHLP